MKQADPILKQLTLVVSRDDNGLVSFRVATVPRVTEHVPGQELPDGPLVVQQKWRRHVDRDWLIAPGQDAHGVTFDHLKRHGEKLDTF